MKETLLVIKGNEGVKSKDNIQRHEGSTTCNTIREMYFVPQRKHSSAAPLLYTWPSHSTYFS